MRLVVIVRNKISFIKTTNIKSSFIWPLYECGEEKQFCLKYTNLAKLLRNDLLWLQELAASRNDLRLLYKYEMILSDIIISFENLRKKKVIRNRGFEIILALNRFRVVNYFTEKLIVRMSKSKLKCAEKVLTILTNSNYLH